MSTSQEQVTRMLALVPYLRHREGVPVKQVASEFGVTDRQIIKDLNVLWFCGLPGAVTGEMIDVDMEALKGDGVVYVDNVDFLPRPVRLTVQEAVALVVALRTMRETAGSDERAVIERALAKLESAAGDAAAASEAVEVVVDRADQGVRDALADALARHRRVHLVYEVPWRDERTERDVDPIRLFVTDGRTYLEGWCHRVQDLRLFRLDRVAEAHVLDDEASPHPEVQVRDLSAGVFRPEADGPSAVLDLHPDAHWVCDYYPVEESEDRPDGVVRVRMRGEQEWLSRFVLRLTGRVDVVEPAALADEVRARARRALGAYSESARTVDEETS